ncbi:MAG: amidohydrolase family protein [Candidatus Lokiarchaeota archaeon]|nr:amidohydrolase family protein [Candidatus Lokiarchaeota archaeon]
MKLSRCVNLTELRYQGPIFDAHSHVADEQALDLYVKIANRYNVEQSLLIVHGSDISAYQKKYPDRFIYAKYFSGWILFSDDFDQTVSEIYTLREDGYGMAKMHFAPFWGDRLDIDLVPTVDDERFDIFFDTLAKENIPVVIHIGDPDTYFTQRYSDERVYGTKEDHIQEFENRLRKSPEVTFQVAHFLAQPEIHRQENLSRMLETYPNLNIDTGSARWMVRELGKDVERSRNLIIEYQDRILFGIDCVARTMDESYYDGRFWSERMLFETDVRDAPLPFVDKDTVHLGGTYINGLDLPTTVLEKIYWQNAHRLHDL